MARRSQRRQHLGQSRRGAEARLGARAPVWSAQEDGQEHGFRRRTGTCLLRPITRVC